MHCEVIGRLVEQQKAIEGALDSFLNENTTFVAQLMRFKRVPAWDYPYLSLSFMVRADGRTGRRGVLTSVIEARDCQRSLEAATLELARGLGDCELLAAMDFVESNRGRLCSHQLAVFDPESGLVLVEPVVGFILYVPGFMPRVVQEATREQATVNVRIPPKPHRYPAPLDA